MRVRVTPSSTGSRRSRRCSNRGSRYARRTGRGASRDHRLQRPPPHPPAAPTPGDSRRSRPLGEAPARPWGTRHAGAKDRGAVGVFRLSAVRRCERFGDGERPDPVAESDQRRPVRDAMTDRESCPLESDESARLATQASVDRSGPGMRADSRVEIKATQIGRSRRPPGWASDSDESRGTSTAESKGKGTEGDLRIVRGARSRGSSTRDRPGQGTRSSGAHQPSSYELPRVSSAGQSAGALGWASGSGRGGSGPAASQGRSESFQYLLASLVAHACWSQKFSSSW